VLDSPSPAGEFQQGVVHVGFEPDAGPLWTLVQAFPLHVKTLESMDDSIVTQLTEFHVI